MPLYKGMVRVSDDDINGQALYRHGGTAAKIAMFSKQDGALLTAQMLQGYSELYRLGQGIQTHAKGQRQGVTNGMTGQQGIDGGVLNGGKQHPLALQGFGFSQHLPQYPCVGTHGTAGGVVAGVGEEGGLAGAVQCGLQGLVWFLSQAGIVELMAAVPHIGGQVLEGARNIYYAEIADPSVAVLSQSVIWDARGISKMFGLIGACLAMYQTARPENREKIKPVLITAAVTSFIAGVTEPIEFSFLFVAPILFVVHAVLAGSSFVVLNLLGCRAIGPNGFIDFLLYNLPLGIGKTRWPVYIAVGVLYFFLYYVIFRVLIVKLNLHTLGREAEGMEMKLHSKSEYKAKVAAENGTAAAPAADNTVDAAVIVEALGGKDNILKVTNCYTRLRTELADPDKVQDDVLKNQTGASAVIHKGKNVQVVYGLKVNAVRKAVDAELGLSGEE